MITASWPRLVIGTIALFVGGATGFLAWAVETCAGGRADSLLSSGLVALGANVIGWALLRTRVPSRLVLLVSVLPALAALSYTLSTFQLASGHLSDGRTACALIAGDPDLGADGREAYFIILWLLVCASFWGGLVPIVGRALRVHGGVGERD